MAGSTAVLFRAGAGANIGTVTMWAMRKRNQPRITFIQLVYQITQHGFMVPKPRHTRVLHRIQMRKSNRIPIGQRDQTWGGIVFCMHHIILHDNQVIRRIAPGDQRPLQSYQALTKLISRHHRPDIAPAHR